MKAIQIMMDEALLARLNADAEVRRDGRSAVLRRAVSTYLQRAARRRIAEAYRQAYGDERGAGEFAGWPDEGTWPAE